MLGLSMQWALASGVARSFPGDAAPPHFCGQQSQGHRRSRSRQGKPPEHEKVGARREHAAKVSRRETPTCRTAEAELSDTPSIDQGLLKLAHLLCARPPHTPEAPEQLSSFLQRHGVFGRLTLDEGKPSPRRHDYTLRTAGFALAAASSLGQISQGLEARGIPCLTFKGMAWSQLLYANMVSRPFGDIDVLVPREQLSETYEFLLANGFKVGYPSAFSPGQSYAWWRFGKAQNFNSTRGHVSLDLHWRLFSQWIGLEVPFADLWQRRFVLELAGLPPIATFGTEDGIVFTALHGSQDGWSHLKALLDLALFLERHPPRWETIAQIAGERLPLVTQAVTFAVHLLGAPQPLGCRLFYSDRETTLAAYLEVCSKPEPPQLALLKPNLWSGSKRRIFSTVLQAILTPAVDDLLSVDLPPRLANLYIGVRLFRLLQKFARRRQLK